MSLCACGCGNEAKEGKRYIWGHVNKINKVGYKNPMFGKVPWNKGIKFSIDTKYVRNGLDNPFYGKHHSKETKQKISQSHLGKNHSEKTKIKISNSTKGNKNCHWKGGISFEPYCEKFNFKKKEEIRNRDNRLCRECGKNELENNERLTVHHIHYDKPNCDPDLISLCRSCNSKANINRDYWEEHFMNILRKEGIK